MNKLNICYTTDYSVTAIQSYRDPLHKGNSYNVVINDKFLIQLGSDKQMTIPQGHVNSWGCEDTQQKMYELYDLDRILSQTELPVSNSDLKQYAKNRGIPFEEY